MLIKRTISKELLLLLKEYPIVTILGPRQSGKTTLACSVLKKYKYVSLENPQNRSFAINDPKAFLDKYSDKVIFDEIQRVPELLSYLQEIVDKNDKIKFVLTGSHQLALKQAVTQTLAGRVGILYLLPFSIEELSKENINFPHFKDYIWNGFFPRIYDKKQRPNIAYSNYYSTYVQRDVAQLVQLKDLSLFEKFIKLLAGRVGQVMNYNSLANDVGVSNNTIKNWLSILEASFIIFKLSPYFDNFGKRVIKSAKYYFMDTGLLSYLLGIEKANQVERDPALGGLFENLVILEVMKYYYNKGINKKLYFLRDSNGLEIDLVFKTDGGFCLIEIKSANTWHKNFTKNFSIFKNKNTKKIVVYNGEDIKFSDNILALHYTNFLKKI